MRVTSFKVSNYRSIDSAEVELADLTCLVGPNNEGKSNLLRALGLGLSAILGPDRRVHGLTTRFGSRDETIRYDPELDRPVSKDPRSLTTITIRFELTVEECNEFQEAVGHSLNGDLPAQVQFTSRGLVSLQYKKQRVGTQLTQKAAIIGDFLRERFGFQYVPAIRTAEDAARVINMLVRLRLSSLRYDEEYSAARSVIEAKTGEALEAVERDLQDVLPRFLPSVKSVHLGGGMRTPLSPDFGIRSIQVNDGVLTDLAAKGSGVQSLAALALLRHGGQSRDRRLSYLLALEEPEAHLHSGALHQLRPLLAEIANEQQLIFSTHAGVLVPTTSSASVVIVRANEARTSRSIADVRGALGVRLSDNLRSARLVLVVEGASDVLFWRRTLPGANAQVASALDSGELVVEAAVGAGNLSYQLQTLRRAACDAFVVYDSDPAGRKAVNRAVDDGELLDSEYLLVTPARRTQAEIEDLLAADWVAPILAMHFGVAVRISRRDEPWGTRLRRALTTVGKSNSSTVIGRAKEAVWNEFERSNEGAVSPSGVAFVARVADLLARRLGNANER